MEYEIAMKIAEYHQIDGLIFFFPKKASISLGRFFPLGISLGTKKRLKTKS